MAKKERNKQGSGAIAELIDALNEDLAREYQAIIAQEQEHQHDLATALGIDVPRVLEGGA